MRELAILSTKNKHVDALNIMMMDKFPGKKKMSSVAMILLMMTYIITIPLFPQHNNLQWSSSS